MGVASVDMRIQQSAGRVQDLRLHNCLLLLESIRLHGSLSRAQLARITGLSQPALSEIVKELLSLRLLEERGTGPSSGRRRPTMLELREDGAYLVGVDLGGTTMTLGLVTLTGKLLNRRQVVSPGRTRHQEPSRTLEEVARQIATFLEGLPVQKGSVLAVGIGLPGVTDPESGVVYMAPALGWAQMAVGVPLRQRLGLPVWIDNDVNAAASAEQAFGVGRRFRDFVFVAIGTGIGAGLVLGGNLYRGHQRAAGEVGYLAIDRDWVRAQLASRPVRGDTFGCWESLAAGPAIVRFAEEELAATPGSSTPGWSPTLGQGLTAKEVLQWAAAGHTIGVRVLNRWAENLALGLTNITVLLNPEAIILGGGVSQAGEPLLAKVREKLEQMSPFMPELLLSELGEDAGLLGAAAVAFQGMVQQLMARGAS